MTKQTQRTHKRWEQLPRLQRHAGILLQPRKSRRRLEDRFGLDESSPLWNKTSAQKFGRVCPEGPLWLSDGSFMFGAANLGNLILSMKECPECL